MKYIVNCCTPVRIAYFCIILFIVTDSVAQTLVKSPPTPPNISVIISPVILSTPQPAIGAQAGLQYAGRKWAGLLEYGIPASRRTYFDNSIYYRDAAEAKRYLHGKPHYNDYLSFRASFAYRSGDNTNGVYYQKEATRTEVNYNTARIISPVVTVSLRAGQQISISWVWGSIFR